MNNFKEVINIGNELSKRINGIGVTNLDELQKNGSKQTRINLVANNYDVCINSLYALEGAIKGIRWHHLSKEEKYELKQLFEENFR